MAPTTVTVWFSQHGTGSRWETKGSKWSWWVTNVQGDIQVGYIVYKWAGYTAPFGLIPMCPYLLTPGTHIYNTMHVWRGFKVHGWQAWRPLVMRNQAGQRNSQIHSWRIGPMFQRHHQSPSTGVFEERPFTNSSTHQIRNDQAHKCH